MSCPIPLRIINPHYKKLSRDYNWDVYDFDHNPDFYIDVPCGQCINCLQSKGNMWSVRLQYHYKYLPLHEKNNSYFVTLTLSDDHIDTHPSILIRRFLERVRKAHKRSFTHWIVSEYGERTKRFHFHAIFFDIPFHRTELLKFWKYGHVTIKPLTTRRITYVTSYVNKNLKNSASEIEDPRYHQLIWCSKGIGKALLDDNSVIAHMRKDGKPVPIMRTPNNFPMGIPTYYRKKIFTEQELGDLKTSFYTNQSEDVIPDPPYIIGKKKFTNYLVYLDYCDKLKQKRNYLNKTYGKRITQSPK